MAKPTKSQIKANVRAWLADLESGKLNQATGVLKDSVGAMCCLGVGCVTLGIRTNVKQSSIDTVAFGTPTDWSDVELPSYVANKLGLQTPDGGFDTQEFSRTSGQRSWNSHYRTLVALNDEAGLSFTEIAAFIRTKPAGLFIDGLWAEDEII